MSASLDFANEKFAHPKGNEFGYTFSLFVNPGKIWDFENPEMVNEAVAWIDRKFGRGGIGERYRERLERGDWEFIESDTMMEFLKSNGYDSFHVVEEGTDNIGIFDPARVKSSSLDEFDDAGNEIPLSQRFDITRNDIRVSSIGSAGAARLGIGGLDEAERMEKEGADRTAIWKKTGWWRGKDGKWRVEIPDIPNVFLPLTDSEKNRLSELESVAKAAKKAYLEAKRSGRPSAEQEALFKAWDDADTVPELIALQSRSKEWQGALLAGLLAGNPILSAYPELGQTAIFVSLLRDGVDGAMDENVNRIYVSNKLTPTEKHSVLAHEIQHVIQAQEGLAKGGDFFALGSDAYWNTAGEVEARNVQARLGMTPEERAATPPWETEDVPEEKQIVRFGDGVSAMAPMNATGRLTTNDGEPVGTIVRSINANKTTTVSAFDALPQTIRDAADSWTDRKDKAGKRALARSIIDMIPEDSRAGTTADGKPFVVTVNSIESIFEHMNPANAEVKRGRVAFAVSVAEALPNAVGVYLENKGLVPVLTMVSPVEYEGVRHYGIETMQQLFGGEWLLRDVNSVPAEEVASPRTLGTQEHGASDRTRGETYPAAPTRGESSPTPPNARSIVQWLLENQEKTSADFDAWLAERRFARAKADSTSGDAGGQAMFSSANSAASVSPEEDAAYMDAVRRGDMETARRIVATAAIRHGFGFDKENGLYYLPSEMVGDRANTSNRQYSPEPMRVGRNRVSRNNARVALAEEIYEAMRQMREPDVDAEEENRKEENERRIPKNLRDFGVRAVTSEEEANRIYEQYAAAIGRTSTYRGAVAAHVLSGNGVVWESDGGSYVVGQPVGGVFVLSHFAPSSLADGRRMMGRLLNAPIPVVMAVLDRQADYAARIGYREAGVVPQWFAGEIHLKRVMVNRAVTPKIQSAIEDYYLGGGLASMPEIQSLVKLPDPVTYDDAGNVIPLSQRFNPEKDDIRYASVESASVVQAVGLDKPGRYRQTLDDLDARI